MPDPIHLEEVGSTNDWIRTHHATLADGQWVHADRQTAGRGRLGRPWNTPAGNLAASLWLLPRGEEGPPAELSFVAALALHDACVQHVLPGRLSLKWPNDLLLDGAKLSGILLEREGPGVIVGIGVNLAHAPEIPDRKTISLAGIVAPADFLSVLSTTFAARRMQWAAEGFGAVRADWLARAHPIGAPLALTSGARLEGRFAGLTDDGALMLEVAGTMHTVHAGDIMLGGDAHAAGD